MKRWLPGMQDKDDLASALRSCRACEGKIPFEPRPIFQLGAGAPILIASQAPGTKAHDSARPSMTGPVIGCATGLVSAGKNSMIPGISPYFLWHYVIRAEGQAAMRRRRRNVRGSGAPGSSGNLVRCALFCWSEVMRRTTIWATARCRTVFEITAAICLISFHSRIHHGARPAGYSAIPGSAMRSCPICGTGSGRCLTMIPAQPPGRRFFRREGAGGVA